MGVRFGQVDEEASRYLVGLCALALGVFGSVVSIAVATIARGAERGENGEKSESSLKRFEP